MRLDDARFGDGRGGEVSAVVATPATGEPGGVVVLAHGAGNDMQNPLLVAVHEGIAGAGFASVRFNFPYKERGGRAPDPAPVLEACYEAVLAAVRQSFPGKRLYIGGKSLGGRMASHLAARGVPCDGLIFLGYPLHPAGEPHKLRSAHLPRITVPMLFLTGTRDRLCDLALLEDVLKTLRAPATLHVVAGGDHSFLVRRSAGRPQADVTRELIDVCVDWLRQSAPLSY